MESFLEAAEKTALGCIATAIVAVLNLAAVSKAELDSHLIDAVQHYFWSVPFLAGYVALCTIGDLKPRKFREVGKWVRLMVTLLFVTGFWLWTTATERLMGHFGIPRWEGAVMLMVFLIPYCVGMRLNKLSQKEEVAQSDSASIDSR